MFLVRTFSDIVLQRINLFINNFKHVYRDIFSTLKLLFHFRFPLLVTLIYKSNLMKMLQAVGLQLQ